MAGDCAEKSRRLHRRLLGREVPLYPGFVPLPMHEILKKTRRPVMAEIFGVLV